MKIENKYTPYRRRLAWLGFITLYLLIPAATAFAIYSLDTILSTTYYNRTALLTALHARP